MMNEKMGRCLWIVILASSVLVAYWIGTKRSAQNNAAATIQSLTGGKIDPVGQRLIDTSKYGMYRVLKDQNDPSKGWTDWVFVPRTSPEVLLEAERARAADRVAQYNRAKQEAAARLAQDQRWWAAREAEQQQAEAAVQAERDRQRQHELALEQARQRSLDDKQLDNIEATVYDIWEQQQRMKQGY